MNRVSTCGHWSYGEQDRTVQQLRWSMDTGGEDMKDVALEREIAAYERDLKDLLVHHAGKFVVYHGDERLGAYDSFQNAADAAVAKYGLGPYLIRQVLSKQPIMPMPASVAYRPVHASA